MVLSGKTLALIQLMRLDKPIGTLLLLWPTLWALWLANHRLPPMKILWVFILGVIVMRAAGCVINDYADRNIDGYVKRTQNRPLPSGRVTSHEARWLFVLLIIIAFTLVLTLNRATIFLSFGALLLATSYPFLKRYTHLPQVVLGAAFGWSIPMAWCASTGSVSLTAWLLFLANLCWTVAYDTEYAMVDRDDDLKIGVKSTAILFGQWDRLIIGLLQISALVLLLLCGWLQQLGGCYYGCIVIAAGLFTWQQKTIFTREREACFQAFLHNNYVGLVLFIGIFFSSAPFL